ncbi:hypothetical protein [Hymenobacter sp. APR13]|uniref:hypothetical protein n=1 Tax=Hymenobacter sp. APR13 TaxID=1356852 RepID=UPI0012E03ECC|nr:hypothetical protein [Hymenobacter sp. APR13]
MKMALAICLFCWALITQRAESQINAELNATQNNIALSLVGRWINHSLAFKQKHEVLKGKTTYAVVRAELNPCLEMKFNKDYTAVVSTAAECNNADYRPATSFNWRVSGGRLIIGYKNTDEEKAGVLPTGKYAIRATPGRLSRLTKALVLTDEKGIQFFLTRSQE